MTRVTQSGKGTYKGSGGAAKLPQERLLRSRFILRAACVRIAARRGPVAHFRLQPRARGRAHEQPSVSAWNNLQKLGSFGENRAVKRRLTGTIEGDQRLAKLHTKQL